VSVCRPKWVILLLWQVDPVGYIENFFFLNVFIIICECL